MNYPLTPGWKGTDTSEAAAAKVSARAPTIRRRVWDALASAALTGEALAHELQENLYSVLPRLSEMQQFGIVRDSGKRGKTKLGSEAVVWERVPGAVYAENPTGAGKRKKKLDMKRLHDALNHLGAVEVCFWSDAAKHEIENFIAENS